MQKFIMNIKVGLIVIFIVAICGVVFRLVVKPVGFSFFNLKSSGNITEVRKVDTAHIASEFKKISELSTHKYSYTDVISIKDEKVIKDWWTANVQLRSSSNFIAKFSGVIKAGVNMEDADISFDDNQMLNITFSKAQILSNDVDLGSIHIFIETDGIFHKIDTQQKISEISKVSKDTEQNLINNGFLDKATENCKVFVESLLRAMGIEKANINFK